MPHLKSSALEQICKSITNRISSRITFPFLHLIFNSRSGSSSSYKRNPCRLFEDTFKVLLAINESFFWPAYRHLPIYSGHSRQTSCRKAFAVMSNVLNLSSVPNPTTSSCSTGVSILPVRRHNFIKTYGKKKKKGVGNYLLSFYIGSYIYIYFTS